MVEFVSANPTGPIHVGNGWFASYGDASARHARAVRLRRQPGVLRQRHRRPDPAARRVARWPARAGSPCPRAATPAGSSRASPRPTTGPTTSSRPGGGRRSASSRFIQGQMDDVHIHFDEWFSQASHRGARPTWPRPSPSSRTGASSARRTAPSGSTPAASATPGRSGSCASPPTRAATTPTWPATSPTTATSSSCGASTGSSTCGAPTTRARCPASWPASRRSAWSRAGSRSASARWCRCRRPDVQAARQRRRPRRPGRRYRGRRHAAACRSCSLARPGADHRPRQGALRVAGSRPSTTCSTPTPASTRSARRRTSWASTRADLASVDLSCLTHERELELLRTLDTLPEVVELAANERAPHKVDHLGPRAGRPVPRLLPRLLRDRRRRRPRADPGPPVAGRGVPDRLRHRPRPARRGRAGVDVTPDDDRPLPWRLLPEGSGVGDDGWLTVGGCSTRDLAAEFGTPLFVYDEDHLRARCREARGHVRRRRGLRRQGVPVRGHGPPRRTRRVCTSTWPPAASCTSRSRAGLTPPVSSCTATTSATAELARAREVGVGRIVVDSFDELDRLDRLHAADGRRPRVLLRAPPASRPTPTSSSRPAGPTPSSGSASPPATSARPSSGRRPAPASTWSGVHTHIGSQVFVAAFFRQAIDVIAPGSETSTCPSCRSAAGSASPMSPARRPPPSPSGAAS